MKFLMGSEYIKTDLLAQEINSTKLKVLKVTLSQTGEANRSLQRAA